MCKAAKAFTAGPIKGKALANRCKPGVCHIQSLLEKTLLEKSIGSVLGVNFSQSFLLRKVFFPAKNSDFFRLLLCPLASAEHSKHISFPFLPSGMLRRCDLWIGICFSWPIFAAKFMTHASASATWLDTAREMEKASTRWASKNELHLNDVLLFCSKKEHLACTVGKKNKMQHS